MLQGKLKHIVVDIENLLYNQEDGAEDFKVFEIDQNENRDINKRVSISGCTVSGL